MKNWGRGVSLGFLVVAVGACALRGESLSVGANPIGVEGGTPEASGPPSDAGVVDTWSPPAGTLVYEIRFDDANACDGWTLTDATFTPVPGRDRNACMLCSTRPTELMTASRNIGRLPPYEPGLLVAFMAAKAVSFKDEWGQLALVSFGGEGDPPRGGGVGTTQWWNEISIAVSTTPTSGPDGGGAAAFLTPDANVVVKLAVGSWRGSGGIVPQGECVAFDDIVFKRFPAGTAPGSWVPGYVPP